MRYITLHYMNEAQNAITNKHSSFGGMMSLPPRMNLLPSHHIRFIRLYTSCWCELEIYISIKDAIWWLHYVTEFMELGQLEMAFGDKTDSIENLGTEQRNIKSIIGPSFWLFNGCNLGLWVAILYSQWSNPTTYSTQHMNISADEGKLYWTKALITHKHR